MGDPAGTDIAKIAKEWGREFQDLEYAGDWEKVSDEFQEQSRWCTHWEKIVRHTSGLTIAINYARNTGDGESADAYPTTWHEVEEREKTVKEWVAVEGGQSGTQD